MFLLMLMVSTVVKKTSNYSFFSHMARHSDFLSESIDNYMLSFEYLFIFSRVVFFCMLMKQVGLPLVQQYLFQFDHLVRDFLPKLGEHFSQEMINPSMYASQWFITVFSYSFPFHLALRIWDVFLFEVNNRYDIFSTLFLFG